MPTYHVDLTTDRGLQRVPFTLDDDRPLGGQVNAILEELRQRGIVLRGGPDDELGIRSNGRDLDPTKTPQALGLAPLYPVELAMRRRRAPVAARAEPPAQPFTARGPYLGAAAGLTGGAIGWGIAQTFTDLGPVIGDYPTLDFVVFALLGAAIGAAVLGMAALRRGGNVPLEAGLGVLLGGLAAGLGGWLGMVVAQMAGLGDSFRSFLVARLLVWALGGAILGLGLGLRDVTTDRVRLVEGLLFGLVAGLIGGLVFSMPGLTQLWQLIGFLILGAGVGYGVSRLHRTLGVLELDTVADRSVGLFGHREWEIYDGRANLVGRRLLVDAAKGRCKLVNQGSDPVAVAGQAVAGSADLLNLDLVAIGDRKYRFRRMPDGTV